MTSAQFTRTATKFVLATVCGCIAILALIFVRHPGDEVAGIALAIASAIGYAVVLLYKRSDDNVSLARPGDRIVIGIAALATSIVAASGVWFVIIGKLGLGLTVFAFSAAAFFASARIGQGQSDDLEVWSEEELDSFDSIRLEHDDMLLGLIGARLNRYTELPDVHQESMLDRF